MVEMVMRPRYRRTVKTSVADPNALPAQAPARGNGLELVATVVEVVVVPVRCGVEERRGRDVETAVPVEAMSKPAASPGAALACATPRPADACGAEAANAAVSAANAGAADSATAMPPVASAAPTVAASNRGIERNCDGQSRHGCKRNECFPIHGVS